MRPLIQQIKMVIKVNGLYPLSKTHERLLELEKVVKGLQNNNVIGVQKAEKSSLEDLFEIIPQLGDYAEG